MNETLKNLVKAFIGESQARNRYNIYAKRAKKEGYEQIADVFKETAEHERQHAKWHFRLINQLKEGIGEDLPEIEVEAGAPTVLGNTKGNLKGAIEGEHYENSEMYPRFADKAKEEGYPEIANRLRAIGKAEEHHENRYKKLLENIEEGKTFEKEEKTFWVCRKCGYVHYGEKSPEECPSCSHPKEYFQIKCEEY